MPRVYRSVLLAIALGPFLSACDDTPGVVTPFGSPPEILTVTLTPEEIDDTSTESVVTLTPTVSVDVRGGEGQTTVRVFIRDLEGDQLLAEAEQTGGSGLFQLASSFEIPRGAIGRYPITITTEDASGRVGDRASAVLVFDSVALGGPSVSATSASPSPVPRPTTGTQTVTLSSDVTDPDGIANVAYVELRDIVTGETLFRFRNDGQGGDGTADDSRYALSLVINASTPVGTYAFDVVVTDRTGLSSIPTEVTFTVQ